jgi:hypothetical protein
VNIENKVQEFSGRKSEVGGQRSEVGEEKQGIMNFKGKNFTIRYSHFAKNPEPLFFIGHWFLVPMLQRGNAYRMGSQAGAWEPGKILK